MAGDRTATPNPEHRYEQLRTLPPSAKLVYLVLDYESPLTQKELRERTRLPARTVRYAISRLDEEALITEDIFLQDARSHQYAAQPISQPD